MTEQDSPMVELKSVFSPDTSQDSEDMEDSRDFSDRSNTTDREGDSSFLQSPTPFTFSQNPAFESTMLTSPDLCRYKDDEEEEVHHFHQRQADLSWETVDDSIDPFDVDESLDLLIENRRKFPDTEFSDYMLSGESKIQEL